MSSQVDFGIHIFEFVNFSKKYPNFIFQFIFSKNHKLRNIDAKVYLEVREPDKGVLGLSEKFCMDVFSHCRIVIFIENV